MKKLLFFLTFLFFTNSKPIVHDVKNINTINSPLLTKILIDKQERFIFSIERFIDPEDDQKYQHKVKTFDMQGNLKDQFKTFKTTLDTQIVYTEIIHHKNLIYLVLICSSPDPETKTMFVLINLESKNAGYALLEEKIINTEIVPKTPNHLLFTTLNNTVKVCYLNNLIDIIEKNYGQGFNFQPIYSNPLFFKTLIEHANNFTNLTLTLYPNGQQTYDIIFSLSKKVSDQLYIESYSYLQQDIPIKLFDYQETFKVETYSNDFSENTLNFRVDENFFDIEKLKEHLFNNIKLSVSHLTEIDPARKSFFSYSYPDNFNYKIILNQFRDYSNFSINDLASGKQFNIFVDKKFWNLYEFQITDSENLILIGKNSRSNQIELIKIPLRLPSPEELIDRALTGHQIQRPNLYNINCKIELDESGNTQVLEEICGRF